MPITIRYAAPRYLTTSKAMAEEASSAERPTVAAAMCTSVPVVIPATETIPAWRPWETLCVTMYSTEGPGTTSNSSAAPTNSSRCDGSGMPTTIPFGRGRHDRGDGRALVGGRRAPQARGLLPLVRASPRATEGAVRADRRCRDGRADVVGLSAAC